MIKNKALCFFLIIFCMPVIATKKRHAKNSDKKMSALLSSIESGLESAQKFIHSADEKFHALELRTTCFMYKVISNYGDEVIRDVAGYFLKKATAKYLSYLKSHHSNSTISELVDDTLRLAFNSLTDSLPTTPIHENILDKKNRLIAFLDNLEKEDYLSDISFDRWTSKLFENQKRVLDQIDIIKQKRTNNEISDVNKFAFLLIDAFQWKDARDKKRKAILEKLAKEKQVKEKAAQPASMLAQTVASQHGNTLLATKDNQSAQITTNAEGETPSLIAQKKTDIPLTVVPTEPNNKIALGSEARAASGTASAIDFAALHPQKQNSVLDYTAELSAYKNLEKTDDMYCFILKNGDNLMQDIAQYYWQMCTKHYLETLKKLTGLTSAELITKQLSGIDRDIQKKAKEILRKVLVEDYSPDDADDPLAAQADAVVLEELEEIEREHDNSDEAYYAWVTQNFFDIEKIYKSIQNDQIKRANSNYAHLRSYCWDSIRFITQYIQRKQASQTELTSACLDIAKIEAHAQKIVRAMNYTSEDIKKRIERLNKMSQKRENNELGKIAVEKRREEKEQRKQEAKVQQEAEALRKQQENQTRLRQKQRKEKRAQETKEREEKLALENKLREEKEKEELLRKEQEHLRKKQEKDAEKKAAREAKRAENIKKRLEKEGEELVKKQAQAALTLAKLLREAKEKGDREKQKQAKKEARAQKRKQQLEERKIEEQRKQQERERLHHDTNVSVAPALKSECDNKQSKVENTSASLPVAQTEKTNDRDAASSIASLPDTPIVQDEKPIVVAEIAKISLTHNAPSPAKELESADKVNVTPGLIESLPIFRAIKEGNAAALEKILKDPKQKETIHSYNFDGLTPLHYACSLGHEDIARMLLDAGVKIDIHSHGESLRPLHYVLNNNHSFVPFLIAHKADVNKQTADTYSPLQASIKAGILGNVRLLLDFKADIDRAALASAQEYSNKSVAVEGQASSHKSIVTLLKDQVDARARAQSDASNQKKKREKVGYAHNSKSKKARSYRQPGYASRRNIKASREIMSATNTQRNKQESLAVPRVELQQNLNPALSAQAMAASAIQNAHSAVAQPASPIVAQSVVQGQMQASQPTYVYNVQYISVLPPQFNAAIAHQQLPMQQQIPAGYMHVGQSAPVLPPSAMAHMAQPFMQQQPPVITEAMKTQKWTEFIDASTKGDDNDLKKVMEIIPKYILPGERSRGLQKTPLEMAIFHQTTMPGHGKSTIVHYLDFVEKYIARQAPAYQNQVGATSSAAAGGSTSGNQPHGKQ